MNSIHSHVYPFILLIFFVSTLTQACVRQFVSLEGGAPFALSFLLLFDLSTEFIDLRSLLNAKSVA